MRRSSLVPLFLVAILAFPVMAFAEHATGYHWARGTEVPVEEGATEFIIDATEFTLTVNENLSTAAWEDALDDAVWGAWVGPFVASEWRDGWNFQDPASYEWFCIAEDSVVSAPRNCVSRNGEHEICDAKFGLNVGWRAITKLFITGSHITRANTKLNNSFTWTTPGRRHEICKHLGYVLGVDDREEDDYDGSCMEDLSAPPDYDGDDGWTSNELPDYGDLYMLTEIYAHGDNMTSVAESCSVINAAAMLRPPTLEEQVAGRDDWGVAVRYGADGRPSLFAKPVVSAQGKAELEVTRVSWGEKVTPKRRGAR